MEQSRKKYHVSPERRAFLQQNIKKAREHRASPELKKAKADAQRIADLYATGTRAKELAEMYGVRVREIYRIIERVSNYTTIQK